MRTKILTLGLICLSLNFLLFSQDWNKLTLSQIETTMENTLKIQGYGNLDVIVEKDVIDGFIDFYIWFDYVKRDKVFATQKSCIRLVAHLTSKTSWKSRDLWFVKRGKPGTSISTKNCRIAVKIKNKKQQDDFILSKLHTIEKR